MLMNVYSDTPYRYRLRISIWRKIDNNINITFKLNSSRMDGKMVYDKDVDDNFLNIYYNRPNRPNGYYPNEFEIRKDESGREFFTIKHSSRSFLELDAISQINHLFKEFKLCIDKREYLLDLENLDEGAFALYVNEEHNKHAEHTAIDFTITEEFLTKYCTFQRNVPACYPKNRPH